MQFVFSSEKRQNGKQGEAKPCVSPPSNSLKDRSNLPPNLHFKLILSDLLPDAV